MKKLLIGVMLLLAMFAGAQDYYPTTPPTLEWDAPASTLLPGDVVEYEVYLWDRLNGEIDAQPIASLSLAGTTASTSFDLDFPYRAAWQVGVRLRHTDGGGNVSVSDMIYSSVGEDCLAGVPFSYIPGTLWFAVPDPTDLRDSAMVP